MGDEAIELDEAARIEEEVETFSGGELALLVLLGDPRRAPALLGKDLTVV